MLSASGIENNASATLSAEEVAALGEDGSSANYGLYPPAGSVATLRGGTYTGRGAGGENSARPAPRFAPMGF